MTNRPKAVTCARLCVRVGQLVVKPNFYSVVAFWTWCNLLGDWHDERLKQDDPNDVTSLVYNTADLSVPVIKASMPQLTQPIIKPMTSRMERQE
eukprot:CAMPEP_0114269174 /NCGR_PEP_ID=MMETSP0058-20121206/26439_1 /TAXON_ID=36894 /ORGANISM="Pyramimonas parkeae, CCMP726" /LENGTH=93 /DNA_ID=CAMNT_0001387577 /DNA_START=454 /DNA_END=734 /DNA_ORIENTATION=-